MDPKIDRTLIESIDFHNRTITLKVMKNPKKITATKLSSVIGKNKYKSPFNTACDICRLYSEYVENKYVEAGKILEPVLRDKVRERIQKFEKELSAEGKKLDVENPIPANDCWYDHFRNVPVFGGMVDGYITADGKRHAVLEIKTANSRAEWTENGKICKAPIEYIMQISLYAKLSKLDKMVFAVAFLEESDYNNPSGWKENEDNFHILVLDKIDIENELKEAEKWYSELCETKTLPPWTEADSEIIDVLTTKKLYAVPTNLEKMIEEYASSENRQSFEEEIRKQLVSLMQPFERKLIYIQNGLKFMVVRDETTSHLIVEPAPKT